VNGTALFDAIELLAIVVQKRRTIGLGRGGAPAPTSYRFGRSRQWMKIQTSRAVAVVVTHAAAKNCSAGDVVTAFVNFH
jgi:hypothetical protein